MKIMVGFDGSEDSKNALALAVVHAKAFTAKVFVVCSINKDTGAPDEHISKMDHALEAAKAQVESQSVVCETHLLNRGFTPGEDLVDFAQANKIDEIIIGIRNRSNVGKLVFGTNAQFVILHAQCPVTTVK